MVWFGVYIVNIAEIAEPLALDTIAAARLLGVSPQLLEKWRSSEPEKSPPFMRIGRCIRYRRSDLIAFMQQRLVAGGAR